MDNNKKENAQEVIPNPLNSESPSETISASENTTTLEPAQMSNKTENPNVEPSRSKHKTYFMLFLLFILLSGSLVFSYYNGFFDQFLPKQKTVLNEREDLNTKDSESILKPEATESAVMFSDLRVKITNGTGISGQAARAQDALAPLKMKETLLDPVATRGATITRIGYDPRVPLNLVDQVREILDEIFRDVEEYEASDTGEFDLLIVTGREK